MSADGRYRRIIRSSRTGRTTARTSTRSGGCCSSASSGCWSAAPAANISTGSAGLGVAARRHPRFPPAQRHPRRGDRLAHRRGAGAGAGRCVLRLSGAPPLSVDLLHPPARPARLPAGAGRLSRHLRPCADADEPGLRRLHAGLRRRRAEGAAASAICEHLARLYWYTVEFGLIATPRRAAHLRLGHPLFGRRIGLLPGRSAPQPPALRPAAGDADPVPDRPISSRPTS